MKKSISLLLIMCIVLAGCGKTSKDTASEEIVLAENQSIKYGQVSKINGNEMTIALATQVSTSEMQSQRGDKTQSSAKPDTSGQSSDASSDKKSGSTSGKSSQGSAQNEAPNGGNPPGDMPGNGEAPSGQSAGNPPDRNGSQGTQGSTSGRQHTGDSSSSSNSSGKDSSKSNTSKNNASKNRVRYQLTGEEETLTIPVGTKVTTSLGTTTTFSRIAANDTLKLLMEKNEAGEEVIVGVWIVA